MDPSRARKKAVPMRPVQTSSDIDALALAMEKKRESYGIYTDLARNAKSAIAKAAFEKIAKDENEHYEILEEAKSSLEDFAKQSIWEEGGPIEGG